MIERALLTGKPIHGVLLDIKKCFDSIPWSIAFGLLEDMGLDKKVTRPLQHMYLNLRRHMKIHGTAGEDFQATNGILQGCALSVIVLNAVVAVWDKVMREEAKVETDAYADDTKFLSSDPEKLRVGIGVTEEFGRRTSLEYTKVHAFSTKRGRHKPVITMGGKKLEMKESFRDVGAEINTVLMQNPRVDGQATRRCRKTFDILDRIAFLPGATDACRSSLVMSMIMPMALYGTETANPQHEALRVGALQGGRVEFCGRRYRCSAVVGHVQEQQPEHPDRVLPKHRPAPRAARLPAVVPSPLQGGHVRRLEDRAPLDGPDEADRLLRLAGGPLGTGSRPLQPLYDRRLLLPLRGVRAAEHLDVRGVPGRGPVRWGDRTAHADGLLAAEHELVLVLLVQDTHRDAVVHGQHDGGKV